MRASDARAATLTDLDDVADTLTAAFVDDPVVSWIYGGRRRLINASIRYHAEHAYLPHARCQVIPATAAALWLPAGTTIDEGFVTEHGPALAEALEGNIERRQRVIAALDEAHPAEPHRFLWLLGVRPPAQGRGLGSALLASALDAADAAGDPVLLDATTTRSRALYEQFGFETIGEVAIDEGPSLWPMWRRAR